MTLFDHDMESCKPFLVIVTVLIMLFVRLALSLFNHKSLLTFPQLAMLCSMHIHPPRICNHRRKTLFVAHLSTCPLWLPLRRRLVFSERNDTLERRLSTT